MTELTETAVKHIAKLMNTRLRKHIAIRNFFVTFI